MMTVLTDRTKKLEVDRHSDLFGHPMRSHPKLSLSPSQDIIAYTLLCNMEEMREVLSILKIKAAVTPTFADPLN